MKPTTRLRSFLAAAGSTLFAISAASAQRTWTPTAAGTSYSWQTAGNWSPSGAPSGSGATANLNNNIAGAQTISLNGAVTLGSLTLGDSDNTHAFTIANGTGGSLTFNNGGSGATLTETGGQTDTISATITLADNLTTTVGGSLTISGAIGGSGSFTKSGTGFLKLTSANTFSGGLNINAGTVQLNTGGTLNALGSGKVTIGDANNTGLSAQLEYSGTSGTNTFSNAIDVRGNGAATLSITGWNAIFNGAVDLGNNLLVSANNNGGSAITFGGGVTGTGNLVIQSNAANPTGGTGTITFQTNALNFNGTITNSGTTTNTVGGHNAVITSVIGPLVTGITQDSTNSALVLSGTNTFTGPISILKGTVRAGAVAGGQAFGIGSAVTLADVAGARLDLFGNSQTIGSLAGGGTTGGNVTLGSGTLTVGNASTTNFAGAISGTGGLIKLGAGTLTLSGTSGYSGTTRIDNGTLSLGHATDTLLNTGAVNVNGGTLSLGANSDTVGAVTLTSGSITGSGTLTGTGSAYDVRSGTVSAKLGGTVGLTKSTTGTVTLAGANEYTGSTIINGGTLDLGGGGTTGSLASTVLTLGGGTLSYTRTDSQTQTFTTTNINAGVTSALSVVAGNILNLGTVTRGAGGYTNFSSVGAGTVAADTASNSAGIMAGLTFGDTWAVAGGAGVAISGFNSYTQTSTAGNTAANYTGLNIDVNSSQSPGTFTANSLRFSSASARTLTLTGTNTITSGGILVGSGVGNNLSTITGGTLIGAASKDLVIIQNNISNGLTIASVIANNGGATGLTKSGAGLLTLTAANTYTGATRINEGTLQMSGAGGWNATYAGAITLASGTTFQYSSSTGRTISGNITGAGGFTKDTSSIELTLSGTNSYAGNTTISAGRLKVGGSANLGSSTTVVQSGTGQLYISGTGGTFSNAFNLSTTGFTEVSADNQNNTIGALRVDSNTVSGTITLSGNSRIGVVTAAAGTISGKITGGFGIDFYGMATGSGNLHSITISNMANDYTGNTTIITSQYNSTALTGGVTTLKLGASNVIPNGANAGNVVFATHNNNNYAGNIARLDLNGFSETINGLSVGTNARADITNSATGASILQIGANDTTSSFSGTITDSGTGKTLAITKIGSGSLTLSGTNTYIGGTSIDSGTLTLGHATDTLANTGAVNINGGTLALGANDDTVGAVTLTSGSITGTTGTLTGTGSAYDVRSGTISAKLGGTVGLTKTTGGTVTLSGTNTYTGATTISAGTLVVNGNISTSSHLTVDAGATLGGSGTVGATTVNGTLAVGNSPGTMVFTNTLTLTGSTIMEIDGMSGAGNTGGHDFINLTGAGAAGVLTYGGTLTLDIGTLFGIGTYSWDLFNMASETGTFSSISLADFYSGNLLDGDLNGIWNLTSDANGFTNSWTFDESSGSLDLNVAAIPEPRAALLGGIGMLLLLRRRRD